MALNQQILGMCSKRGVCAPLDSGADGYVKGDAVCCVLLQRRPEARRLYATIRSVRINVDGFKKDGMFRPGSESQTELMVRTYTDAGIDPTQLTYIEGHCAGTQAGDVIEMESIYNAYCKPMGRTDPLPFGSVKSNMGHAEGSSGLSSLIKVLIAYENELIPPNLNLNKLRDDVQPFVPPIMPVVKPFVYKPGSIIIKKISEEIKGKIKYDYKKQMGVMREKTVRPLWVLFPGLGGQWPAMAKALMPIKIFADTIEECHQILDKEFGIDLKHILLSEDKTAISTMTAKFVATTALQVSLFAVIKDLGITPDGIIGHSFGEIACAFADGCLTVKEAMIYTAFRAINSKQNAKITKGLMAFVGLSRAEALKYCSNDVYIACNNASNSVVISDCDEIPYHSPYISESAKAMREDIKKYVPNPKLRSNKWLSTSVLTSHPEDEALKYSGGEYFEYNMSNEVRFYEQLQKLPVNAVVLELSPHSIFGQIVNETLKDCTNISLLKMDSNHTNMDMFLSGLAQLYELGFNLDVHRLYPSVEWPVARNTQSIASLIKWDHNQSYPLRPYEERYFRTNASNTNVTISHKLNQDSFYLDHIVDGQPLYPATGFLMLVWRKAAASVGKFWIDCPVVFENIHFKRAVFLSDSTDTKLVVKYSPQSGEFTINEKDELCVTGRAQPVLGATGGDADESALIGQQSIDEWRHLVGKTSNTIDRKDIYNDVRALCIDHGPAFQRLSCIGTDDFILLYGRCEWTGNAVTYLDGLLLATMIQTPSRKTSVPVMIRRLCVDPRLLFDSIKASLLSAEMSVPNNEDIHIEGFVKIALEESADLEKQLNDRYAVYSAEMPFRYNSLTRQLVSPGIEIDDLVVHPIARRPDTNLTLESYEFCPNNDMEAIDDSMRSEMLQYIKKKMITFKETANNCDNIWLMANDTTINGIIGLMNCLRLEPGGEIFRYIFYNDNNNNETQIDFTIKPYSDILANDLVANVMKGEVVGTYRHLKLPNDYDKCLSNDYFLNMGQTRDISGLQWFDGRNVPLIKYDFGNNKVDKTRVDIYCSGISSRDISITSGHISGGFHSMFTDCLLGGEYAGRRADTGQRVMGIEFGRCIATHVNACVLNMAPIPDHWSMAEAVTVLNSYSTVYYALIKKANILKDESVLIHSGAGSVGQAAINVCQHFGCDIYVTVGTEEEKQFLIKEYNIPENRIFSSRDMRFKSEIIEATNGRGIDVVLNSLTGKKSDLSFECLAKSGRFIELNKSDHGQNRKHNPYDFDGDIQYIGVSANLLITDIGFLPEFYEWIQQNSCPNGFIRPLNYIVFGAKRVVDAFCYMTTGRHIEKVVLKYRDESSDVWPMNRITPAYDLKVDIKTYFNSEKVFIITGGLGGMGLELMSWMHMRGARKFVLTSRSGIKTNYQKFFINRMKSYCKTNQYFESQIIISTANGLTIEGSKQLLSEAKQLGPIGGVFHLALVLNDCLFENMTIEKFGETVDTKHRVFANLDQLTRQLDYKLDYFVVFSSQFTGSGFDGQTNY
ncbi:unnamed protein product, partial [Medioppia subpectinata]